MKRIEFVSDRLVEQIIEGRITASVVHLDMVDVDEDEYNHALVVGRYYEIFDSDDIPDRLWKGEANLDADEFRADHLDYFDDPEDDFEFIAYYFHIVAEPKITPNR
jgi:uncharacterized protein YhfF